MIEITSQQALKLIEEIFRGDFEEQDGVYRLSLQGMGGNEWLEIRDDTLRSILERLSQREEKEGTILYNDNFFEILVQEESSDRFPLLRSSRQDRNEIIEISDSVNGLVYILSRPSEEYLIYLLFSLSEIMPIRSVVSTHHLRFLLRRRQRTSLPEEDEENGALNKELLFWLSRALPRYLTLQIRSEKSRSVNEFEKLASAFLFQLSYNLDVAVVPQRSLDKLVRKGRIRRLRRSRIEEMEAPKRIYNPDLIYHYQMAVSAESPPLEYLSYYHIAEHFFESIFHDDLIERVRQRITEPDFSYRRKKDIKKLVDEVTRSLRIRNDQMVFSEEEALRLTLERFLDLEELLSSIREYNESLVDYFRNHKVSFSGGKEVDLEHDERDKVIRSIAKRIYKTRNAIVHSKESEKSRYIPFRHDQELTQEVILLRFVAEQIIINSSEMF